MDEMLWNVPECLPCAIFQRLSLLWRRLGHSEGMDSTYRDGTSKQKDRWGTWGEEKTLRGTHANGCLPLSLHSYRDLGLFVFLVEETKLLSISARLKYLVERQ